MMTALTFCGVWLGGYLFTLFGWKLFDNRIFDRWDVESSVEGDMLVWWPMYLGLLIIWVLISLFIILPVWLLLQRRPKQAPADE